MNDPVVSMMILSLISVLLFCACCHLFLREVTRPVPVINHSHYAKSALRVAKAYKAFSWGVLMIVFLVGLVMSFAEVFARL